MPPRLGADRVEEKVACVHVVARREECEKLAERPHALRVDDVVKLEVDARVFVHALRIRVVVDVVNLTVEVEADDIAVRERVLRGVLGVRRDKVEVGANLRVAGGGKHAPEEVAEREDAVRPVDVARLEHLVAVVRQRRPGDVQLVHAAHLRNLVRRHVKALREHAHDRVTLHDLLEAFLHLGRHLVSLVLDSHLRAVRSLEPPVRGGIEPWVLRERPVADALQVRLLVGGRELREHDVVARHHPAEEDGFGAVVRGVQHERHQVNGVLHELGRERRRRASVGGARIRGHVRAVVRLLAREPVRDILPKVADGERHAEREEGVLGLRHGGGRSERKHDHAVHNPQILG
mmetsp:Transcript_4912/g.12835  ORF Transcript_4912/g.12835 Transcript_4912/m.12835 type:complete len:348 (+) Transcript_4912:839-1882(+)